MLILAGHGRTCAFLVSDLGIVSFIVVLRVRIGWTVLPKVTVSVQATLLISVGSCAGSLSFLLPDVACFTSSFLFVFMIVFMYLPVLRRRS